MRDHITLKELNQSLHLRDIKEIHGLEKDKEQVVIEFEEGDGIILYHEHDCCESVLVEDVEDNREEEGGKFLKIEVASGDGPDTCESSTWTFYDIKTTKGNIWLRWLGESNGYYSEEVNIVYCSILTETQGGYVTGTYKENDSRLFLHVTDEEECSTTLISKMKLLGKI